MEHQHVRKTYGYRLMPTPEPERALAHVLWRCRTLYNAATQERRTAWERCRVFVGSFQQKAEMLDLKAEFSDYTEPMMTATTAPISRPFGESGQ